MTKNEILKTHKMTEQEFYKKFPTQEAYNQFQMGGSLPPKQKFQMGGLTPLVATYPTSNLSASGTSTPAAATAPDAAAPGNGFKLANLSGLGGGQQAPQQAGSDPNAPVQKNIGKTIGSVAGGIAGSFIPIPGVGTMIGGAVGGAIGGAVDKKTYENKMEEYSANKSSQQNAMTSNIAGNFNPNAQGKTFKMGGNFTEYHGNTHENGGIPIGVNSTNIINNNLQNMYQGGGPMQQKVNYNHPMSESRSESQNGGRAEVEDGETNYNGFINSNSPKIAEILKPILKGKTPAQASKEIAKKYSKRSKAGDKITLESEKREQEYITGLGEKALAVLQEPTGLTNNSRGMFQYGGNWMKNINNLTNQANDFSNYRPNNYAPNATSGPLETPSQQNSGFYTTDDIDSNKKAVGNITSTLVEEPTNKAVIQEAIENERSRVGLQTTSPTLSKSSTSSTPLKPLDTNKPLQTKVNPLGYLASAIGPAYNIAQGLKGGDPVNFDRMTSKYQYADPRGAMAAANRGITAAYNPVKNAAKNTTTSAAEYLANMTNIASKEGMERAATMASIKGQSDMANTQGLNQSNLVKDQYNAQAQMQNAIAQQQENDAAISSISQGLNNFGQNTLGYGQDVAMNKSQNMMTPFMADRFDLVEDAEGNISFKRKAIKKSDSKKDITPAPETIV